MYLFISHVREKGLINMKYYKMKYNQVIKIHRLFKNKIHMQYRNIRNMILLYTYVLYIVC